MRIVIAPDSFKGTLTAAEVAAEISAGWCSAMPDAVCVPIPLADGGEGTVEAMVDATGGELVTVEVEGPYGAAVMASYGLLGGSDEEKQAVIEMSAASGLHLRASEDQSPRFASSFGTGQLIRHALDSGVRHIILGLGGSATNDGGAGMAQALGASLVTASGDSLARGGSALQRLESIDRSNIHPAVEECVFEVACDVENPLTGPDGASAVFGPQKGASPDDVVELDRALSRFAAVVESDGSAVKRTHPGGGAAGGLGFGAMVFLGAELKLGIDIVMDTVRFGARLVDADLVITGEGRMDAQTLAGKAPFGVLRRAQKMGVPVIAIVGSIGDGAEQVIEAGMAAIFDVVPAPIDLEGALDASRANLRRTSRDIAAVWLAAERNALG